MIDYIEIIGLVAGVFSTFATLPQIVKVWKTKSAQDISFYMFMMSWTGTLLWIVYGMLTNSFSLVVANIVTCFLVSFMLIMKFKFDARGST